MSKTISDIIWRPSAEYLQCRITDFMRCEGISDWQKLVERSTKDIPWFWNQALKYMGVRWFEPYKQLSDESKGFAWTSWFLGGRLNIVDNCIDYHVEPDDGKSFENRPRAGADHTAIIWESEDGDTRTLTYGQLNDMVCRVASCLRSLEVKAGDAVGIYMPMVPEAVAVLFGCLKVGAIPVLAFTGIKPDALTQRLEETEAKVLFTAYSGKMRGKIVEIKPAADEAVAAVPTVKHVVVLERFQPAGTWQEGRDLKWSEAVAKADPNCPTAPLDAEALALYLYTSGTTGKPKCTIQTHAGALATTARNFGFTFDVKPNDTLFWYTDFRGMTAPWELIGTTFWGGTVVIYEGAINYPQPDRIWKLIEKQHVTIFGISPSLVRLLRSAGDSWVDGHDFSSLRLLGSTSSPWDEETYMWFFEHVGQRRCPIINVSGGTELFGGLVQCLPVMPLKPCTLGWACLGMDVDVVDDNGKSIRNAIGHLICRKPAPSMTKGILKDPARYIDTYFSQFPDVWYHGDWAKIDADGYWYIYCRASDTLKIDGKRVGPHEIEAVLVEHSSIVEAATIGIPQQGESELVVCFAVLKSGTQATKQLAEELAHLVADKLGSAFKPHRVHLVDALPRTYTGKSMRGLIRRKYLGEPVGDLSWLENPQSLDNIPAHS